MHTKTEHQKEENKSIDKFIETMTKYGKRLALLDNKDIIFCTGVRLDFCKNYNSPTLDVTFTKKGDFFLSCWPSERRFPITIYSSRSDEWKWEEKACKKFIKLNKKNIISTVRNAMKSHK